MSKIMLQNNIDSEYFASRWFLTLFTFDLGIGNISSFIDLFMIEGFKSLIKISLAILSTSNQKYAEGVSMGSNEEGVVDFIKHYSEQTIEPHTLLKQSQKFKVTQRLMHDMEKLYNKENRNRLARHKINPEKGSRGYKGCRSSSLKGRMLVITTNK
jgi:hypothetical protein